MNADNYKYSEITEQIIEAFYKGCNTLVYGFLEKVYENALFIELVAMGLFAEKQKLIKVYCEGKEVGEYFADLIVHGCVAVELKTAESLCKEHGFQLII